MSDYDFRANPTNQHARTQYQSSGSSSSGLWLIAAGVVVLLLLGFAFIGGGTAPPTDGQISDPAAADVTAPTSIETAPVPATE